MVCAFVFAFKRQTLVLKCLLLSLACKIADIIRAWCLGREWLGDSLV